MNRLRITISVLFFISFISGCATRLNTDDEFMDSELIVVTKYELDKIKSTLTFMDLTLSDLPDNKIEEFAFSPLYDSYRNIFRSFGLEDSSIQSLTVTSEGDYIISKELMRDILYVFEFMKDALQYLSKSKLNSLLESKEYSVFIELFDKYTDLDSKKNDNN